MRKDDHLVFEAYKLIRERSKAEISRDIVKVLPNIKASTGSKKEIRIQPAGKIPPTDEDLRQAFARIGLTLVEIAPPKTPESKSSKFATFVVKDQQEVIHYIVLGGGAESNKGMAYERQMSEKLKNELPNQNSVPFFIQLKEVTGPVEFTDVKPAFSGHAVRRQLTDKPHNAGEIISDLTLVDSSNKLYYISLKNISGLTVANNSLKQMFVEQEDSSIKVNDVPTIDPLLNAAHLDKQKVADLIKAYTTGTPAGTFSPEAINDADTGTIRKYIASAFDYGYYYVRELKNDKFEIKDLTTEEKLNEFIGDVINVSISYPYYAGPGAREKRKAASIITTTSTGQKFVFSLRNKQSGTIPTEITLTKF
jgi:hypothetical protein